MKRLFPERQWPGEGAVLHHLLVPAPSGVDQNIQAISNPGKRRRSMVVEQVIARHPRDATREVCTRDGSTGCENPEAALCESDGCAPAHAAACSGDQRCWHLYPLSKKPVEYSARLRANPAQVQERNWCPARQQRVESIQLRV